jgi:hypothetical protein
MRESSIPVAIVTAKPEILGALLPARAMRLGDNGANETIADENDEMGQKEIVLSCTCFVLRRRDVRNSHS